MPPKKSADDAGRSVSNASSGKSKSEKDKDKGKPELQSALGIEPRETRTSKVLCGETISKIQKKWGSVSVMRASDLAHQEVPRLPSGIFQLDYALGGGFAAGRINTIYGEKSASKTTTILKTIANAQNVCANCFTGPQATPDGEITRDCRCGNFREMVAAFIDVEGTLDLKWAAKLGVQNDRLLVSTPEYAEESLDIMEALVRSGDVDIVCLDSLAFLTAKEELENSHETGMMAVQSRVIGRGIRKLTSAMAAIKNEHSRLLTVFFTNQIRMKVGFVLGDPTVQPGGKAPGFAATVEVKVWPGKYEMDELTGRPVSAEMKFRVEKNKSGPAKMEGLYKLILTDTETKRTGEVMEEEDMVKLATKYGAITGGGGSWTCLGQKFSGKKEEIELELARNPQLKKQLRDLLIKTMLAA